MLLDDEAMCALHVALVRHEDRQSLREQAAEGLLSRSADVFVYYKTANALGKVLKDTEHPVRAIEISEKEISPVSK